MFEWIRNCFCGTKARTMSGAMGRMQTNIDTLTTNEGNLVTEIGTAERALDNTNDEIQQARIRYQIEFKRRELELIRNSIPIITDERHSLERAQNVKTILKSYQIAYKAKQRFYS